EEFMRGNVAADLLAYGSIADMLGISTMESVPTGMPVVAADALALPHLVDHGRNGYLYRPGDVAGLADRLLAVLRSGREAMGAASREIALTHDHRRSLARFEEIYTQVRPTLYGPRGLVPGRAASPAGRPARPRRHPVPA